MIKNKGVKVFFRKKELIKLKEMNQTLSNSFGNVRTDVDQIFSWITYLNQQNTDLSFQLNQKIDHLRILTEQSEERIQERILKRVNEGMKHEIKAFIDYYYNFEHILKQVSQTQSDISDIRSKIGEIYGTKSLNMASHMQHLSEIKDLRSRLDGIEKMRIPQKTSMREKLIKKITQKSKDYVKNLLLSYIRKYQKISAIKLREMIVEEQGMASKSSFYRILSEIEALDEIEVIKEGKEKYYFYKLIKHV